MFSPSPRLSNNACLVIPITLVLAIFQTCHAADGVSQLLLDPVDAKRSRTVPLKVYLNPTAEPQPVILFSHGLGGSRENNAYLGVHWAEAGYVAVFMQHAGSDLDVWKDAKLGERLKALKEATGAKSLIDRAEDVSFVIDQLEAWTQEANHPLHGRLNLDRIGMSGHSFGAATTMAVSGRKYPLNRSFAEKRIDAFFAMSPPPEKRFSSDRAFGHLAQPVLCMTGTEDASPIDPTVKPEQRLRVFEAMPSPDKYQLVLDGGEHHAFGDSKGRRNRKRNPKHHPAIQKISLQFWDAYLKEDLEAKSWLQSQAPIGESDLSNADAWHWK